MKKLRRFRVQVNDKDVMYVEGEGVRYVGGMLQIETGGKTIAVFLPGHWRWVCEEPA